MILSPHIIAGAALGANFQNPYLIALGAIILHHTLDKIPHYDYKIKPISSVVVLKIIIDILFGILSVGLVYLFFNQQLNILNVSLGGFFGVLPDGFLLLSFIFPENKWSLKYQKFHASFHFKQKNSDIFTLGILTQIIVISISAYLLY